MTPNNCVRVARVRRLMLSLARCLDVLPKIVGFSDVQRAERKARLVKVFAIVALEWKRLVRPPPELNRPLGQIDRRHVSMNHLTDKLIP